MADFRFPVGTFEPLSGIPSDAERASFIANIRALPEKLSAAVAGLNAAQLATPYRDGGWMVRQVVHHLADSHMNAYVRTKLILTEDQPTIKPYKEAAWAEVTDARGENIESSLSILRGIHARWHACLASLAPGDFQRTFNHPEHGIRSLDWILQLYSWHGRHHTAHITSLRERMKW